MKTQRFGRVDPKYTEMAKRLLELEEQERKRNPKPQPKTPQPEMPTPETPNLQSYPTLNGFFYVPKLGLYLAKERDLNNLDWNQAVEEIYTKGIKFQGKRAEMPTPLEFLTSLVYVLDTPNIPDLQEPERTRFLDDILKFGDYRGNWLNSKFVENPSGFNNLGIETIVLDSTGKPAKQVSLLQPCLEENTYVNIRDFNSQGLFTTKSQIQEYKQGETAYFWTPLSGFVSRFGVGSGGASLGCGGDPSDSDPSLGVRFVVRAEKLGDKK